VIVKFGLDPVIDVSHPIPTIVVRAARIAEHVKIAVPMTISIAGIGRIVNSFTPFSSHGRETLRRESIEGVS
jgi:hypothetical protein